MDAIMLMPDHEIEEFDDMGSHNHSLVQANLAYLFKLNGNYSVGSYWIPGIWRLKAYNAPHLPVVTNCLCGQI